MEIQSSPVRCNAEKKSQICIYNSICTCSLGARSKFWEVSGSEDRGVGDNSIQFINIGRVGDKSFKEWRRRIEGGSVGDNSILTFLCYWLVKKMPL